MYGNVVNPNIEVLRNDKFVLQYDFEEQILEYDDLIKLDMA